MKMSCFQNAEPNISNLKGYIQLKLAFSFRVLYSR